MLCSSAALVNALITVLKDSCSIIHPADRVGGVGVLVSVIIEENEVKIALQISVPISLLSLSYKLLFNVVNPYCCFQ